MRSAFTLVELLVVIAIVSILAAILFPAFAYARHRALGGVGEHDMRQLGIAIIAYMDDGADGLPPPYSVAGTLAPAGVQCAPLDNWSPSCPGSRVNPHLSPPMLGSFGYSPSIVEIATDQAPKISWDQVRQSCPTPSLLVDPFDESAPTCPWFSGHLTDSAGMQTWMRQCLSRGDQTLIRMPEKTAFLTSDGAIHTMAMPVQFGNSTQTATWLMWWTDYQSKFCKG